MKRNPRDFFRNRLKKRAQVDDSAPLSPRSRSLRSHYRLRSEQKSTTCRCDLEKHGLSKIHIDFLHHYLLELVYDILSTHFYKEGIKQSFEESGIFPVHFSFVTQVEIYFFIENFIQELEVIVTEEKKGSSLNNEKTVEKERGEVVETKEEENNESDCKSEVDGEETEAEEEGEDSDDKLLSEDDFLSVGRLKDIFREMFMSQFDENLKVPVVIPKTSIAHCVSVKGRRNQNEDRFCIISDVCTVFGFLTPGFKIDYYAVFDGHSGYGAAEYCQFFLPGMIVEKAGKWDENNVVELACKGVRKAFTSIDEQFEGLAEEVSCSSGTTATVVLVIELKGEKHIVLANCGDSSGFVSVDGEIVAQTVDHKPDLEDEKDRIELTGGRVTYLFGTARVMGSLGVSRSIGDIKLKKYGVVPTPDIKVVKIDKEESKHGFFVIASDGLWDVMSQKFVNTYLMNSKNGKSASSELLKMAMARNTKDNVTIIFSNL